MADEEKKNSSAAESILAETAELYEDEVKAEETVEETVEKAEEVKAEAKEEKKAEKKPAKKTKNKASSECEPNGSFYWWTLRRTGYDDLRRRYSGVDDSEGQGMSILLTV